MHNEAGANDLEECSSSISLMRNKLESYRLSSDGLRASDVVFTLGWLEKDWEGQYLQYSILSSQ